jgi:hypothetical protein
VRGAAGARAAADQRDHLSVGEKAVEDGAGGGGVAEPMAPVLEGPVRGQDDSALLVAPREGSSTTSPWMTPPRSATQPSGWQLPSFRIK